MCFCTDLIKFFLFCFDHSSLQQVYSLRTKRIHMQEFFALVQYSRLCCIFLSFIYLPKAISWLIVEILITLIPMFYMFTYYYWSLLLFYLFIYLFILVLLLQLQWLINQYLKLNIFSFFFFDCYSIYL